MLSKKTASPRMVFSAACSTAVKNVLTPSWGEHTPVSNIIRALAVIQSCARMTSWNWQMAASIFDGTPKRARLVHKRVRLGRKSL